MVKFEYAQVTFDITVGKILITGTDGKEYKYLMDALNAAGQDGWELVCVDTSRTYKDTVLSCYLMKRPILDSGNQDDR